MFDISNLKNTVLFIILFWFQICFQNLNQTKIMDFILSGWYLRRKNPIVSIKYITHIMKHTLRVKCSTKIVYLLVIRNLKISISLDEFRRNICLCVSVCLIAFTSMIYYIHVCGMIINEHILYIVIIKRGKIQLVGENRKKWYGGRLHLIHDAPPLLSWQLLNS